MNVQQQIRAASADSTEHFGVVIAGAGISGVGAAYHLTKQCPGTSFVVLEAQASFGGTWRTHRYPGIRSDSDLHTFGYRFKPWTSAPIATAAEILSYMGEVIEENGLGRHIRYRHKISSARWSSEENLWTIEAIRTDSGEAVCFTANFFWMCQGYYRHAEGYTPEWKAMETFKGRIVHPQSLRRTGSGQEGPAVRRRSLSRARLRYRDPLHAKIPAVAAAHRLHSGRRSVPGHQVRQGLGRHRRDRPLHRERHPAEVRQDARSRHHRHRDRLQPERQRRHGILGRRRAARFRRHRDLSRHDVHRRAQPRLGVRIFPGELDAAGRSGRRFCLSAAQPYEANRGKEGHARFARGRPQHA